MALKIPLEEISFQRYSDFVIIDYPECYSLYGCCVISAFTTCSAPAYRVTVTSAFPERLITVSLPSVFTSPADTEAAATFTRRTA